MIATLAVAFAVLVTSVCVIWWIVRRRIRRELSGIFLTLLAFPFCFSLFLVAYIIYHLVTPVGPVLCLSEQEGITLTRSTKSGDDPQQIVIAKVDLRRFTVAVSPPDLTDPQMRYRAMSTSDALRKYGGELAVNASFFRPFRDKNLFDYYPHAGDLVSVVGGTVFNSREITAVNTWPMLVNSNGQLKIVSAEDFSNRFNDGQPEMAVAGKSFLVKDGDVVAVSDGKRYPRTAVGLDATGSYVWLAVADGKQPGHSEGIELDALAKLMVEMGAIDAIELDGGGSSTMAVACNDKIKVINRPSHTNLPARERPVANHLIIRER
ncbi:MAG TPA: phosphodiester glycosidase family protein [Cellvibrio sp.]|nr:phosphodiester glycosidase family protein [Cellvibrio sp.]